MISRNGLKQQYLLKREVARANRSLDLAWRLVVLVIGGSVLGLGLFFIIFPGPGWATIILGLLVLGTEFQWALRILEPLQNTYRKALAAASENSQTSSRMTTQLLVTMALVVVAYFYLWAFGVTAQPFFNLATWLKGLA